MSKWSGRLVVLLLIVGASLITANSAMATGALSGPPPVSQAAAPSPVMIYPPGPASTAGIGAPGASTFAAAEGHPIVYNNGYVQHRPHVYAIFWGSEWNEKSATREKLLALYRTISGSTYQRILTQYSDYGGPIGAETDLTSFTDTRSKGPASEVGAPDVKEEVQYAISAHPEWGGSNYENQYVVFTPPRTPQNPAANFCAYHGWSGAPLQVSFTYVPWSPESCRRGLEPWGAMQVSASHEWAESASDPIPIPEYWGWVTGEEGGEIADLCNTQTPAEHSEIAPGIWAAKLADDYLLAANGQMCTGQDAEPLGFRVSTGASTIGVHRATVSGSVTPAGWPAYYQFEIEGPGGTTYIPPHKESPLVHYGFAPIEGWGAVPVSAEVSGLLPNTTYHVRLKGTSRLLEPAVIQWIAYPRVFSGGESSFTTPDWRPIVSTEAATSVEGHGAVLHATVNPQGADTHYQFEYGATTGYGTSVPVPSADIGAGVTGVKVENPVAGLEEATVYHFRVSATNSEGTSFGADREFRTPGRPVVVTEAPLYTNTLEPQLAGTVTPNGAATKYQFEYGTTTAYGTKVPVTAEGIGSGLTAVAVANYLNGLQRNTTYHYRVVAENEVGSSVGVDRSFTTLPPCKGPEGKCVWSAQATLSPTVAPNDQFEGVSCASATMCMAVGNNANTGKGFGQLWNGTEWAKLPLETWNRELKGISCASTTSCMIIEKNSNGSWEMKWYEFAGGIWYPEGRVPPTPPGATEVSLQGVSCNSESACTAVGSYLLGETYKTLALRWNGTSWSQQATPNPAEGSAREAMLGVSCPSATFCTAVGKAGGKPFAERWNGSEWLLASVANPTGAADAKLEGVSCTSSSACTAVGYFRESTGGAKTLVESWNGTSWAKATTPNPEGKTSSELSSVSCLSPRACTAVGQSFNETTGENKTVVEALTGTTWAIQASPNPNTWSLFSGVSCTSSIACTAVGSTRFGFSESEKLTLGERYG